MKWREQAACRDVDPAIFFPERGEDTRLAKSICAECPVVAECLDYALHAGLKFGIFGGKSERQRRLLRRDLIDPIAVYVPSGRCGTNAGYTAHRRRAEPACDSCKAAHALVHALRAEGVA